MNLHHNKNARKFVGIVAAAAAGALVFAGCAASPEATVTVDNNEVNIPASIADSGVLRIGTTPIIGLPWTALDEKTNENIGLDADLGRALGEVLGLKVEFVNLGFDSLIPSLEAERIDLIMSDMLDTTERQQAIDFVDYVNGGDGMLVQADSGLNPRLIDELCGYKVGALRGAAAHISLEGVECPADNPIDIQLFPDTNAELTALDSGRLDVAMGDPSIWGYLAAQEPELYRSVGDVFNSGPLGIGVMKDSSLVKAVKVALDKMIADGSYAEVLAKYSMPKDTYLSEAIINGK